MVVGYMLIILGLSGDPRLPGTSSQALYETRKQCEAAADAVKKVAPKRFVTVCSPTELDVE